MKICTKLILNILLYPIYLIGLLIPKSKNIWVFGSWFGNSYSDNSKYLFEYITNYEKDIKPIWLTKDKFIINELKSKNLRCYNLNSFKGFYYTARAYVIVVSQGIIDVNKFGISNQIKVLLWHGTPIKKIAFDDNINAHTYNKKTFILLEKIWNFIFPFDKENWDLITSASEEVKEKFISAFRSTENAVKVTGYPRYDILLNYDVNRKTSQYLKRYNNKKIILYAPTFRDGNIDYNYFTDLNKNELNLLMIKTNSIFIVKLHPKSNKIKFSEEQYSNLEFINNEILDINIILSKTDILITDYSSIYIDFLLFNKPIIFTPFDFKNYIENNRNLYYDYYEITPGKKCNSWDDTLKEIKEIFNGNDHFSLNRKNIKTMYHKYADTNNCSRITNRIKNKYE